MAKSANTIMAARQVLEEKKMREIAQEAQQEAQQRAVQKAQQEAQQRATQKAQQETVQEIAEQSTKQATKETMQEVAEQAVTHNFLKMGVGLATIAGISMLAKNMSDRKGHQSNQELYGQRRSYS